MLIILLLLLNLLISAISMTRALFFFFLTRMSFTVAYYEVIKRKSSKHFFIVWSLWSLIHWILLAKAQNLRKVCNSSLLSNEKHSFIICSFSLGILIAHVEPEHQNQHPYMCGDGVLGSSSKPTHWEGV